MNRLAYLRKLAHLGSSQSGGTHANGIGLEVFRTRIMEDPERMRRVLFGANALRRQQLSPHRRSLLRALDVHPDLLGPMDSLRYEPSYTRLIAYHLDARRCPLAPDLLRAFLQLCGAHAKATRLRRQQDATVTPEYSLADGRVDVRLSLPSLLVFVEVKIDATEGDAQLARYYRALDQQRGDREGVLAYLTLPGHEPPDSRVPYVHVSLDQLLVAWLPVATGPSDACTYLARFLKSMALLLGYAAPGTFEDWSFGAQRSALDLVEEI